MTILELMKILDSMERVHKKLIFTLREMVALAQVTPSAAGMTLLRAQKKGVVHRVGRKWINLIHPPTLEEVALSLDSPSYISFENALYRHGILSQSPRGALSLVTLGRPRMVETPLGRIQFIHLQKRLFFGFDAERVAYPEKAWLDLVYMRCRLKSTREFSETLYLDQLNQKRLREFSRHFPDRVARRVSLGPAGQVV